MEMDCDAFPPIMSGFVRRAERKVISAERCLEAARKELARQIELEETREREKAERMAEKKAREKAARNANPSRIRMETSYVLLRICMKRNLIYSASLLERYFEWKKVTEFPSYFNLYKKLDRFLRETFPEEERKENAIPIYAKTMTGELIPLSYHAHYDQRDLQFQLQCIDPDQFPVGSTRVVRLSDDPTAPVEENEIFGLYQSSTKFVRFSQYGCEDQVLAGYIPENGPCICYTFWVEPTAMVSINGSDLKHSKNFYIYHYPEKNKVDLHHITTNPTSLEKLGEKIANVKISIATSTYPYQWKGSLTQEAAEELAALFQMVRRNE